uniref:Uncharacterized protein n=1 Tax=Spongospora subterranea TaxID=70186 RepID=A0A0H5RTE8_9EUKA|eukprot:CRZ12009.1 hypothetical protein [Spongospora subterranea]
MFSSLANKGFATHVLLLCLLHLGLVLLLQVLFAAAVRLRLGLPADYAGPNLHHRIVLCSLLSLLSICDRPAVPVDFGGRRCCTNGDVNVMSVQERSLRRRIMALS